MDGMNNIIDLTNNVVNPLMPHIVCWNKTMDLIWLHVISDLLIAFSYFSIPVVLLMIIFKRPDIKFKALFLMFALFITSCGLTHIMSIITVWKPWFWGEGYVKLWCAIVSLITAISLYPILPSIIHLKGKIEYQETIDNLELQVKNRDEIIDKIIKLNITFSEFDKKMK